MGNNIYWIMTLLFSIILFGIIVDEKRSETKQTESDKAFAVMLYYGLFFCLQDMVWGFCYVNIIPGDRALFISTCVFYVAIVFTSFFCLRFIMSYMSAYMRHKNI